MKPTPPETTDELIRKGYRLELSGDIGGAVDSARRALDLATSENSASEKAAALVCLSYLFNHMGRYEEALNLAEQAVEFDGDNPRIRVDALMTHGICLSDLGRLEQTEKSLLRAMDLAREQGYKKALQKCLHVLSAGVYIPRGQFDLAIAADEESLQMAEDLESPDLRWLPLLTLGWTFWTTGKRQRALETLDRLRHAVLPYSLGEGYYFCLAADLAQDGDDWEEAVSLYGKARSIADIIGDPGLGAELRTGLSRYHRRFGSASTAYHWACDAVDVAERAQSSPTLGWALIEKAQSHWALGEVHEAEKAFHRVITHSQSVGALFDLARTQLFLAALLVQRSDESAGAALAEAVDTIRSGGYWFLLEQERALIFPLIVTFLNGGDGDASRAATEMFRHLERLPPPPLHITTLGSFEIRQGRQLIPAKTLERRRAGDLMRLLLASRNRSIESDRASEEIWPEKPPSASTANLHQATSALRRALEPDLPDRFPSRYLKVHQGSISLHLPEESTVDFDQFEKLFKSREYSRALDLYGGDLFPGNLPGDSTIIFREHLKQRAIQAGLNVASRELEAQKPEAALETCLKTLRLEPWQEKSVLMGMQALVALDNRAGAIRLYRRLCASLKDELDVEPQQELQEFFRSVLAG
ncbi:MAG: hypothetical protein DRJ65_19250 [Acidobacteria bacterium]|nr:MAG: hypothetical protein DRJ65_19250 [Acidobacteriota bacterium]